AEQGSRARGQLVRTGRRPLWMESGIEVTNRPVASDRDDLAQAVDEKVRTVLRRYDESGRKMEAQATGLAEERQAAIALVSDALSTCLDGRRDLPRERDRLGLAPRQRSIGEDPDPLQGPVRLDQQHRKHEAGLRIV